MASSNSDLLDEEEFELISKPLEKTVAKKSLGKKSLLSSPSLIRRSSSSQEKEVIGGPRGMTSKSVLFQRLRSRTVQPPGIESNSQ